MSRRTSAAARIQPAPIARVRSGQRVRTTLGDLVAAAYEAIGPGATAADVRRLLHYMEREGLRPQVAVD